MQAFADVHDTPDRTLLFQGTGNGIGCTVQVRPRRRKADWDAAGTPWPPTAQLSAKVPAPAMSEIPTAMHALGDAHDTPFKLTANPPDGFGVGWITQVVPFQYSAKHP